MDYRTGRSTFTGLLRSSATIILALSASTAAAAPVNPQYTVGVINDYALGRSILAQKYDKAIGKLAARETSGIKGFYIANNLCVAYLKSGQLEAAQSVCDRAVTTIEAILEEHSARRSNSPKMLGYRKYLAVALSNRGVVFAVNGAPQLAREDFVAALETQAYVQIAENNLARLDVDAAPAA